MNYIQRIRALREDNDLKSDKNRIHTPYRTDNIF